MSHQIRAIAGGLSVICFAITTPLPADAATLNPPPPPGSRCLTNGDGNTTCFATFTQVEIGVDAGVDCGTFEVQENSSITVNLRRTYNPAGDIIEAVRHIKQPLTPDNTWVNPVNGKSIEQGGDWTVTAVFGTPGDFSTITFTLAGDVSRVRLPSGKAVVLDAGKIVFDPAGSITFVAGPHHLESGDLVNVCASLA